ncbi:Toxin HigB / Protein kinase domain of HipA [hydrothermal vent metagenome]|uniref:Toxin HigB / Protein kinase domain of HipA n=1 Tax=hydrothermal vent metagenome TaxID=652676 RepID=A0A3B0W7R8_9ZZZZ
MNSGTDVIAKINIFVREQNVGTITFSKIDECLLEYDKMWKEKGFPLSPALPLSGQFAVDAEINFLKNLFPEGDALDELLKSKRISKTNVASILQTIGHDTAGALVFSHEKPDLNYSNTTQVTQAELITRLDSYNLRDMLFWHGKYRLSIAGVQNKLNVLIDRTGGMFLADGMLSSTHILKFPIVNSPLIAINEYFCMTLAKMVGLPVANVRLEKMGDHYVLIVTRFDRIYVKKRIKKAHTVDGCQVLNLPPAYKYEHNMGAGKDVEHIRDGAAFKGLFSFAKQCDIPGRTKLMILDWTIFNLIIGNSDAHGKNISFFVTRNSFLLAPFYDLVSVIFEALSIPKLETELAMAIGDNFNINKVTAYDLLCMCEENNIGFKLMKDRMYWMIHQTFDYLNTIDQRNMDFDKTVTNTIIQMKELIIERCKLIVDQLDEFDNVRESLF